MNIGICIPGGIFMDFSNPTVLANAIMFHDNMVNLQNHQNTYNPPSTSLSSPYYIPPTTYNSPTSSEYQSFSTCGSAVSEYSYPEPIKDTLNTPYILEEAILGREYLRIVMGMLSDNILIVSVLLHHPKTTQLNNIILFVKERTHDFSDLQIKNIIYVISGKFSEDFKRQLIKKCKNYEEVDNKIIISKKLGA